MCYVPILANIVKNVATKKSNLVFTLTALLIKARPKRPATSAPALIDIHTATSL